MRFIHYHDDEQRGHLANLLRHEAVVDRLLGRRPPAEPGVGPPPLGIGSPSEWLELPSRGPLKPKWAPSPRVEVQQGIK